MVRRFPARRVAGGRGKVGEKYEGLECYLPVVLARRERAGGGGSAERDGRGGSGLARRRSGDDGVGDLGRGGSVEVWEGDGEARSGNEGRKRPVRGELELAGGNGGQRAGSGREGRVLLLL